MILPELLCQRRISNHERDPEGATTGSGDSLQTLRGCGAARYVNSALAHAEDVVRSIFDAQLAKYTEPSSGLAFLPRSVVAACIRAAVYGGLSNPLFLGHELLLAVKRNSCTAKLLAAH